MVVCVRGVWFVICCVEFCGVCVCCVLVGVVVELRECGMFVVVCVRVCVCLWVFVQSAVVEHLRLSIPYGNAIIRALTNERVQMGGAGILITIDPIIIVSILCTIP